MPSPAAKRKPVTPGFSSTFTALKKLLTPYATKCEIRTDHAAEYVLFTKKKIYRGQQLYFAGVKINKNYVSFHLMTIYGSPEQRSLITPALKKRMQGKSCFNFTSPEPGTFADLAALVKAGAQSFLEVDELDTAGMKCD